MPHRHFEEDDGDQEPPPELDLHGLNPVAALQRLQQFLHATRVQGLLEARVITGRGRGTPKHPPVLRQRVELFLSGPQGRALGVKSSRRIAKGGALELTLAAPGEAVPPPRPKPPSRPKPRLDPRDF